MTNDGRSAQRRYEQLCSAYFGVVLAPVAFVVWLAAVVLFGGWTHRGLIWSVEFGLLLASPAYSLSLAYRFHKLQAGATRVRAALGSFGLWLVLVGGGIAWLYA